MGPRTLFMLQDTANKQAIQALTRRRINRLAHRI